MEDETTLAAQDTTETAGTEDVTLLGENQDENVDNADGEKTEGTQSDKEVPETYDIKAPEGMELDQAMLDAFTPIFKELGISQEAAQKLADTYAPLMSTKIEEIRQEGLNAFQEVVNGWKDETLKELGSENKKALAYAAKCRQKFGNEKFVEMLNETGVGNHPEMVKFLINIGKTISEDSFVDGNGTTKVDPLKAMYPTMQ